MMRSIAGDVITGFLLKTMSVLLRRTALIVVCGVAADSLGAFAKPTQLAFMNGVWIGDGVELTLDTARMLANIDATKPFQRDALILQNITDQMVVFSIGNSQFIGLFNGNELALTGGGITTTIRLSRR